MKKHKSILILLLLLILAYSSYLDSQDKATLSISQTLTSPLGYYKLRLLSNCNLLIQAFDTNSSTYKNSSIINNNLATGSVCSSINLSVQNQSILTNDLKVYRKAAASMQAYNRFVFGINDVGFVYLVSYWQSSLDSMPQYIVQFLQSQSTGANEVKPANIIYNLQSTVSYANKNGWNFNNKNGFLTITKRANDANNNDINIINVEVNKSIDLRNYQIKQTGLIDPQGQIRYSAVPGLTLKPRASLSTSCGNPEGVFIQFDEYWPIIRIYDRKKYLVAQYSIDNTNIYSLLRNERETATLATKQSPCPQKMYELNGQCYISCPDSYFKQIHGKHGTCTLNCEEGSYVDETNRICYSYNGEMNINYNIVKLSGKKCVSGSSQYEYGCVCRSGLFYNGNYDGRNECVSVCPQGMYGMRGICSKCPNNCKTCAPNGGLRFGYLSCRSCSAGYTYNMTANTCILSNSSGAANLCSSSNFQNCLECVVENNVEQCIKCMPFYALSSNKLQCSYNCFSDQIISLGAHADGYCVKIANNGGISNVGENYISLYNYVTNSAFSLRKSGTCPQNTYIWLDSCVSACPASTVPSSTSMRCVCLTGMATFLNSTCSRIEEIEKSQIGYYYNSSFNSYLQCGMGCLKCEGLQYCMKCGNGYVLVIWSGGALCRLHSLHFNCDSQYYSYITAALPFGSSSSKSDDHTKICIENAIYKTISNISNCRVEVRSRCALCNNGMHVNYLGNCVADCGQGYFGSQGICISSIHLNSNINSNININNNSNINNNNNVNSESCAMPVMGSSIIPSTIDQAVLASPIYKMLSMNNKQISNEPVSERLAIRDELGILTAIPLTAALFTTHFTCRLTTFYNSTNSNTNDSNITNIANNGCTDPSKPYTLLSNNSCVAQCPAGTKLYNTSLQNGQGRIVCLPPTYCYTENSTTPYQLENGTCVNQCSHGTVPVQFGGGSIVQCVLQTACQSNSSMTPFQLPGNNKCVSACPAGTSATLENSSNLVCTANSAAVPQPISIDASVINVDSSNKIYYFVVNKLLNLSDVKVNYVTNDRSEYMKVAQSQSPSLQGNVQLTQVNNNSVISINTTADQVVLDFSKNINQFATPQGNRLASAIYGVHSTLDHITNSKSWLAIIAYVLSLILIILHCIYVGNQLLYKVDNWLIFIQSLYYFSFVHLLINTSIGQFYYGFLWSHFGFYPNYFAATIPSNYIQGYYDNSVPNSYRLLTGDANFIRNAGFSFSLLITFLFIFIVVCTVLYILQKCCKFHQLFYKRIAKSALIAAIEFVAMNIFYWAVAHLLYNKNRLFSGLAQQPTVSVSYRTSCSIAAIVFIALYSIYMVVRFVFDKIGGLYMFKRLGIAAILAASSYQTANNNYKLYLIPLAILQLIFLAMRYFLEKPYLKRQKIFMLLQTVLMMAAYFTIYLWNDTGFVSIYISLIVFLFIFLFVEDLMDVFLDNRDEYYDQNVKILPGLRHKQFNNVEEYEKLKFPESNIDGGETGRRFKTDGK